MVSSRKQSVSTLSLSRSLFSPPPKPSLEEGGQNLKKKRDIKKTKLASVSFVWHPTLLHVFRVCVICLLLLLYFDYYYSRAHTYTLTPEKKKKENAGSDEERVFCLLQLKIWFEINQNKLNLKCTWYLKINKYNLEIHKAVLLHRINELDFTRDLYIRTKNTKKKHFKHHSLNKLLVSLIIYLYSYHRWISGPASSLIQPQNFYSHLGNSTQFRRYTQPQEAICALIQGSITLRVSQLVYVCVSLLLLLLFFFL